ncbi:unnamed protein product [Mycena citricolor]|uniref:DUF6534 domain-containing protein n=1 Tax=Mycena citricolor TaxID=2018698 RepID=A0AAD2I047_9AGAR|nr:unnamed protein product [Mycena citricolor]
MSAPDADGPRPDMGPFLFSYGTQLAGTWVNMMLFACELVLATRYLLRPHRPRVHRLGIAVMLLADTICTLAVDSIVLTTVLSIFGKLTFRSDTIPTTISILATYITAAIEQSFLCQLYYILSRKKLATLLIVSCSALHLAISFAGGIMLQISGVGAFPSIFQVTAVGAITCSATDVLIAGLVGYELNKIRLMTSKGPGHSARLLGIVRRVLFLSLISGAIVASTTLLMMILFIRRNVVFDMLFFCQGRVYALTLLINFLSGPQSASAGITAQPDSAAPHSVGATTPQFAPYCYEEEEDDDDVANSKAMQPIQMDPRGQSSSAAAHSIPIPLWELTHESTSSTRSQETPAGNASEADSSGAPDTSKPVLASQS